MKKSNKLIVIALLVLCGCSSTPKPDSSTPTDALFATPPGKAKYFFYATYERPDDRPYFNETFILHSSNGDYDSVDADHFISTEMVPGSYSFNVEEISGFGNSLNQSSVTVPAPAGTPVFIAETVMHDGKIVLAGVPTARGEEEIMTRKRRCLCQTALKRLIDSL